MVRSGEMIDGITAAAAVSRPPRLAQRLEPSCWLWPRWRPPWSSSPWKDRTSRCFGSSMPRRWSPDFQRHVDLDRDDDRAVLPEATASPDDDQQPTESR